LLPGFGRGFSGRLLESGLRFAPAARGDEAAYTAIHGALVRYCVSATNKAPAQARGD
jgi:hypothetical protein